MEDWPITCGGIRMSDTERTPPDKRIDGLIKLAELRQARWANRRQIEWKTSASVWAFLAALCSAIALKSIRPPLCGMGVFLVATIAVHLWWVHQNWRRNREDTRHQFAYVREIHTLVSKDHPPPEVRAGPRCMIQDAVPTCEVAITVILAVTALYLSIRP